MLARLHHLETITAFQEGIASAERGDLEPAEQVLCREVVGEVLRLMEERDLRRVEIRKMIAEGLESQRRDDLVDGEAVFDRPEARFDVLVERDL